MYNLLDNFIHEFVQCFAYNADFYMTTVENAALYSDQFQIFPCICFTHFYSSFSASVIVHLQNMCQFTTLNLRFLFNSPLLSKLDQQFFFAELSLNIFHY